MTLVVKGQVVQNVEKGWKVKQRSHWAVPEDTVAEDQAGLFLSSLWPAALLGRAVVPPPPAVGSRGFPGAAWP